MAWNDRYVSKFNGDDTVQWNKRDSIDGATWYGDAGAGNKYYFEDTADDFRSSIAIGSRIVWGSEANGWKNATYLTPCGRSTMIVARIVENVDADYDPAHPYRVELTYTTDGVWVVESNLPFYILKNGGTSYLDSYASPTMAASTFCAEGYNIHIGSGIYGPTRCFIAPEFDFINVFTVPGYVICSIYIEGFVIFDAKVGDVPSGYDVIDGINSGAYIFNVYGNGTFLIRNFISGYGIKYYGFMWGTHIDNCLHGADRYTISGQPGGILENCIFSNILSYACKFGSPRNGEIIQNNTFYNIGGYALDSIESRTILLRNNIFSRIKGKPYNAATTITAKQVDYNCYYDIDDMTEMPSIVGFDVHSLYINPQFVDSNSLNFALMDGSLCSRPAGYCRDKIGAIGSGFATSNNVINATWTLAATLDSSIDTPPYTNPNVVSGSGWVPVITGTLTPDLGTFDDPAGVGAGNFVYNQSPVNDNSLVSPVFDVGVNGNFRKPLFIQLQVDHFNLFGLQIVEVPIMLRLEMRVSDVAFAQDNAVLTWVDADSGSVPYGTDLHDFVLADNKRYVQYRVTAYRTK